MASIMLPVCQDGDDDDCHREGGEDDLAAYGDDVYDFVNWQLICNKYVVL